MINLDQEQQKVKIYKINTFESVNALYEGRELIINTSKSRIFPTKTKSILGKGRPSDLELRSLTLGETKLLTRK